MLDDFPGYFVQGFGVLQFPHFLQQFCQVPQVFDLERVGVRAETGLEGVFSKPNEFVLTSAFRHCPFSGHVSGFLQLDFLLAPAGIGVWCSLRWIVHSVGNNRLA